MNLFARFAKLKQKVGGNREKREFEYTMRADVLELNGITPPGAMITRVLSEINFALHLSQKLDGLYDAELAAALGVLEAAMGSDGVLTNKACAAAESILLPLEEAAKEYELLQYLAVNNGIVLSREKIEDHIWNYDYEGGTNVVDVYIRYLRKKIDDGFDKKLIHTVRGMGYVLREEK
jgi:hypothetical protein